MTDKIITCIDGSTIATDVCHAAIWAANRLAQPIMFLHSIERHAQHGADNLSGAIGLGARSSLLTEMAELDEQRSKIELQLGKDMLEKASERAEQAGCKTIEKRQRHGDIVDAVAELENEARLIVMGRSGEGHQQAYQALGSHIEKMLRQVSTPVFIAAKDFIAPTNFMLAYDGRDTADRALQRIIEGGLLKGLTCHLVTVKSQVEGQNEKFELAKQRLIDSGFDVQASQLDGPIFEALQNYKAQNSIELLVMGAFAHSKVRQFFLGSNTMRMIEKTPIPLVVLR